MTIFFNEVIAKQEIRMVLPQANADASHLYYIDYIDLTKLALAKNNKSDEYEIKFAPSVISQGRATSELADIKIYQTGRTVECEKNQTVITPPLLKGFVDAFYVNKTITKCFFPLRKRENSFKIQMPKKILPKGTLLNDAKLWLNF